MTSFDDSTPARPETPIRTCYVYLIEVVGAKAIKIGYATDPVKRLQSLQTGNHQELSLKHVIACDDAGIAARLETMLHRRYESNRLRAEWFAVDAQMVMEDIQFATWFASIVDQVSIGGNVESAPPTPTPTSPWSGYVSPERRIVMEWMNNNRELIKNELPSARFLQSQTGVSHETCNKVLRDYRNFDVDS